MSAPTSEQVRQLSEQAQNFVPESVDRRRLSNFLTLAPKTSDSYPRTQNKQPKASTLPTGDAAEAGKLEDAIAAVSKHRTSSVSSDGSKSRLRFLKLGPVHWGEHQGDHKDDFHEVAVE
jgi:hypothetical protein